MTIPALSFVAKSGTGKTTLLVQLIAVASDEALLLDVPLLDLNDPGAIADFIEVRFLRP
jgi:MinD superfamily P-loop ATPase